MTNPRMQEAAFRGSRTARMRSLDPDAMPLVADRPGKRHCRIATLIDKIAVTEIYSSQLPENSYTFALWISRES